jgi:hypothetical protein
MKPVTQTITGGKGNCFEACIASILECSIYDIPYLGIYDEGVEWGKVLNKWLAKRGLQYMEVTIPGVAEELWSYISTYHLLIAPTKQSEYVFHAVVAKNGKVVHDPHPGESELVREKGMVRLGFLIFTGEKA